MKFSTFPNPLPLGVPPRLDVRAWVTAVRILRRYNASPKKGQRAPFLDIQVYTIWAHKIGNYESHAAELVVIEFPFSYETR